MTDDIYQAACEPALEEADACEITATPARQGMTPAQVEILAARLFADVSFRMQLLCNPKAAAAHLGIELTDWERDEILRRANAINRRADAILTQPGATIIIPLFSLR